MDIQAMSASDRQALMVELQDAERADQQRTFDRNIAALLAMFDGDEHKAIAFANKAITSIKKDAEKRGQEAMCQAIRGIA
jgi:hypothetical protein